ncbi:MAG: hypothetical protein VX464_11575 [Pseudomonadota bacterium]|nr:hypothetical protein [Pseudomonadota bacterium]
MNGNPLGLLAVAATYPFYRCRRQIIGIVIGLPLGAAAHWYWFT